MNPGDGNPAAPVPPPPPRDTLGRLGRLLRKELREILRDRRTIITLVLMPLLLYPLLGLAFRQFFLSSVSAGPPKAYRVGVHSVEEAKFLEFYLGQLPHDWVRQPATPFQLSYGDDLDQALRVGMIDVAVRVDPVPPIPVGPNLHAKIEAKYVSQFALGQQALNELEKRLALANQVYLLLLRNRNRPTEQPRLPTQVEPEPVEVKQASVTLAALIPVILILMTITGAVYPAIDLTAGERERGTLEVLMAAPIPRLGLLFAKYVAVLAVATLTALVNLVMMTATLMASGLGPLLLGDAGLSFMLVVKVLGLLLLFAAFFSAVLLTVASFARSFKEAQAYLIPLTLLSLGPGLLGIVPGIVLTPALAVTPVINMALLARDLFEGQVRPESAAVAIVATLLYGALALSLAARVFGAEAVLYREQAGWSDLFRRPAEPRPAPTVGSAFLCLALLLPAHFLITGFLSLAPIPTETKFLVLGLSNVVIVAGIPLLAARLTHVRAASALQWRRPPRWAWAAALCFGLSLWPFLYGLGLALRSVGLFENEQAPELVQQMVVQWRQLPFGVILLVLAVAPAVCEELLFRGYLFSALRPQGSAAAILGTAALFGLLHTLIADVLALERLLPTTLLGVALGWLCWRSGSVLPGMLLHALNNASTTALAYFEPELGRQSWLAERPTQLLWGCYLAAAVGLGLGAALTLAGRHGNADSLPAAN